MTETKMKNYKKLSLDLKKIVRKNENYEDSTTRIEPNNE